MSSEERLLTMLESLTGKVEQIQQEQKEMREEQTQMRADMGEMQKALTRVALTQENIVLKSLDALAEGQSLTHQRLKDLAGKDELAELREEVRLLRTVVAQHTREIEALKAAQ